MKTQWRVIVLVLYIITDYWPYVLVVLPIATILLLMRFFLCMCVWLNLIEEQA
jgi:hypothetical protein